MRSHSAPPHHRADKNACVCVCVSQTELEALEKRQAQYSQMEAHSTKLAKEVKQQQEALADYNTVLDKVCVTHSPMHSTAAQARLLQCRTAWVLQTPHARLSAQSIQSGLRKQDVA